MRIIEKSYVTMGEAEKIAGTDRHIIHEWIIARKIKAYQVKKGGWWKVNKKSLLDYLDELGEESVRRAIY